MRRFVAILLLLVLSVQFSWAAAASYCEHEKDATPQHIGHHEHEHSQAEPEVDKSPVDAPDEDGSNKATGAHADCAYCHLSAAKNFSTSTMALPRGAASSPALAATVAVESHLLDRIERPKWHRA
jgi:hypothetical protein